MNKLKIKKFHPEAVIPKIATAGAACVDVVATEIIELSEGKVIVKFGFGTEIPLGYKAVMAPRSSFTHKGWIVANSPCQIDADYRGEWMMKFEGVLKCIVPDRFDAEYGLIRGYKSYDPFPYKAGDRCAQMWLEKVIGFEFEEVEELSDTDRGQGGFGSTNV